MNESENILKIPFFEMKKPFKKIDISKHDVLEIQGLNFPLLPSENSDIKVEEPKELKQPLTVKKMIEKLKEKYSISFSTEEEIEAKSFLKHINYYRLSIFIRYLREKRSFTDLKELYEFDAFIGENINMLIAPLEIYVRTSLSYVLTNDYLTIVSNLKKEGENIDSSLVYLDKRVYKNKYVVNKRVDEVISFIAKSLHDKQSRELSIAHHIKHYGGYIPFWVLVENITFGELLTLLNNFERQVKKHWIDNSFPGNKIKGFEEWLNTIRILRNTGAHCSRFYGRKFPYNPNLNDEDLSLIKYGNESDEFQKVFKNTFFAGIMTLKTLYIPLQENDRLKWNGFIRNLDHWITKSNNIDKSRLGFNEYWIEALNIK